MASASVKSSSVKSSSVKSMCSGCNKEFTQKTLDEHNGICGRCFNKKNDTSAVNTAPVLLPNTLVSTSIPSQYSLPGTEMKLANLSLVEPNSSLTIKTRIDNWYMATTNNDVKNNAAAALTHGLFLDRIKAYEMIPSINLLNIEKAMSLIHKTLAE